MIQIAICDDNIIALANMANLIEEYRVSKYINCEFSSFKSGLDLISAVENGRHFDIYCLDVLMPAFTGIDTAKEIRKNDKNSLIIFFTSSQEYAFESYSVNAVNYVLKPVTKEKLFYTLDMAIDKMKIEKDNAIVVKSNEGIQKILLDNLVYAEVSGRTVCYYIVSGKSIKCIDSFASVCDNLLKYGGFVKPHRSYIVNMRFIDLINNSNIELQTNQVIPIAQGKTHMVKEAYLAYQMEE